MPQTIYTISSGEYSDFSIIAAFSTREKAEQAIADLKTLNQKYGGVNDDVIDFTLDEIEPFAGRKIYEVQMDLETGDGNANLCDTHYDAEKIGKVEVAETKNWHPSNVAPWMKSGRMFRTWCLADDAAHAMKIAGDRRAMERANPRD